MALTVIYRMRAIVQADGYTHKIEKYGPINSEKTQSPTAHFQQVKVLYAPGLEKWG
jgi:hypothetical protein